MRTHVPTSLLLFRHEIIEGIYYAGTEVNEAVPRRTQEGRAERLKRPARPQIGRDTRLVFVVVQALFQLVDGDVDGADCFDTMAAEVVRSMFEFSLARRSEAMASRICGWRLGIYCELLPRR